MQNGEYVASCRYWTPSFSHFEWKFLIIVRWAIGPTCTSIHTCTYSSILHQQVITQYVPHELSALSFLCRQTRRTDGDKKILLLRSNDHGNGMNVNFLLTTTVVSQATEPLYMVPFVAATLTFSSSFVFILIQYTCRWEILINIV